MCPPSRVQEGSTDAVAAIRKVEAQLRMDEGDLVVAEIPDDDRGLRGAKHLHIAKRIGLHMVPGGRLLACAPTERSLLHKWNTANPDREVTKDFHLFNVNGVSGKTHKMFDAIEKDNVMSFVRPLSTKEFSERVVATAKSAETDGVDAAGHRLARLLQLNKHAHELYLKDQQLGALAAKALAFALKSNRTITMLSLDKNDIGPEGGVALAEALKSNDHLTALHVYGTKIGPSGTAALCAALSVNKTLETLNLGKCGLGPEGGMAMAASLRDGVSVQALFIQSNGLGEEAGVAIAEAVAESQSLEVLRIQDNKLGAKAGHAFAELLAASVVLEHLDITKNGLGTEAGLAIAEALEKSSNDGLKLEVLKDNGLGKDVLERIKKDERVC